MFAYEAFDGLHSTISWAYIDVVPPAEHVENSLSDLAIMLHNSHDVWRRFVTTNTDYFDEDGRLYVSWRVHMLPYLSAVSSAFADLYQQFRLDEPWDTPHNLALMEHMPEIYRDIGAAPGDTTTRFQIPANETGEYFWRRQFLSGRSIYAAPRFTDNLDGSGNTAMVYHTGASKAVPWTQPTDFLFDVNDPYESLGITNEILSLAAADGRVFSFDPLVIPETTIAAMATWAEGELVDGPTEQRRSIDGSYHRDAAVDDEVANGLNNLRQIGLAFHNHHDVHGAFSLRTYNPREYFDAEGKPNLSWRVYLLPFLGHGSLYDQFRLEEPWDSEHNMQLLQYMPDIYRAAGDDPDSTTTRLQVFSGENAPFLNPDNRDGDLFSAPRSRDFEDGTSHTILAVETGTDRAVPWTAPFDITFNPEDPFASLGQVEKTGAMRAVFADGRGGELGLDTPAETLSALVTLAGLEPIDGITVTVKDEARSGAIPDVPDQMNRLRYAGLAAHNFHYTYNYFPSAPVEPPGRYRDPDTGVPYLSWRVWALPMLEHLNLFKQFNLEEPWDGCDRHAGHINEIGAAEKRPS